MAKYFSHKPQYRRGTTPRPVPVLEFTRDFRSGEFDFTGEVYTPDPRSSRSGRVPSVPRQSNRSWGSPVNFESRAAREAQRMREFRRAIGRGISGAFRMVGPFWDAYDAFRSIEDMLGGQPYSIIKDEPAGGGPVGIPGQPPVERNWHLLPTGNPAERLVVPTPDYLPGWDANYSPAWVQGAMLNGFRHNNGQWYWGKPYEAWHRPPANSSGTYPIPDVLALGPAPVFSSGRWRAQNRLQTGLRPVTGPEDYGTSLGPYAVNFSKGVVPGRFGSPSWFVTPFPINSGNLTASWPKIETRFATMLPWEHWGRGVPWRRIIARNRAIARVFPDIRSESYGPPLQPNKPPSVIHRPPGRNEIESKRRTTSSAILWWYRAAKKTWHEAGEYCDRVNAIFDALPKDLRTSYKRSGEGRNVFSMRGKISCADKTAIILQNMHRLDVGQAIFNLVENEIEDRIIGAGFKSLDEAAKRLGIPGWRLDLGMSGNVEEAIKFLMEIKGLLR